MCAADTPSVSALPPHHCQGDDDLTPAVHTTSLSWGLHPSPRDCVPPLGDHIPLSGLTLPESPSYPQFTALLSSCPCCLDPESRLESQALLSSCPKVIQGTVRLAQLYSTYWENMPHLLQGNRSVCTADRTTVYYESCRWNPTHVLVLLKLNQDTRTEDAMYTVEKLSQGLNKTAFLRFV